GQLAEPERLAGTALLARHRRPIVLIEDRSVRDVHRGLARPERGARGAAAAVMDDAAAARKQPAVRHETDHVDRVRRWSIAKAALASLKDDANAGADRRLIDHLGEPPRIPVRHA